MLRTIGISAIASGLLSFSATALAQQPAPPAPAHDTKWYNDQLAYIANLKASDGWLYTGSGLRYRRIKAGPAGAPHPRPTDSVTIHYAGKTIDGAEFDSSIARGEPATFPLPRLIKGWQQAVPLMAVGDTFELAIPQQLAYGPKGKGPIPGGATLLFTIQLLGIGEAPPAS